MIEPTVVDLHDRSQPTVDLEVDRDDATQFAPGQHVQPGIVVVRVHVHDALPLYEHVQVEPEQEAFQVFPELS
jgi:hypothetical protein